MYILLSDNNLKMTTIHNYKILEKIGQGQFGVVYRGKHERRGTEVAIKCEPQNTPYKLLKRETTILNMIYHTKYIPPILWFGKHNMWQVLVLPYYSLTLENYVINSLFSSTQSSQSIIQHLYQNMIEIMEHIHKHHVVHRDLKPQNFMIHNGNLVLIDFGLAIFTIDENGDNIPIKKSTHITGNVKFVSLNTHYGYSISPKDEMISCFYILLWMVYGKLPWSSPPLINSSEYDVTHVLHPLNMYVRYYKEWGVIQKFIDEYSPLDISCDTYWNEFLKKQIHDLML